MSWIDFEFELRRDYPLSEIIDLLVLVSDCGGMQKAREILIKTQKLDLEQLRKCDLLEKKCEQLEKKLNDAKDEYNRLIYSLLIELRDYAHSTYVRFDLDEVRDIIVYRPYDGDLFNTNRTYHFFIIAKCCPEEVLSDVFNKDLPTQAICQSIIDFLLQYCSIEVNG